MKMLMEIKKKKYVLLEDEASNWLHIWTETPSLDFIGNKAIKKIFFPLTGRFPKYNHILFLECE